jgi:2-dehydropantoate 2-reductase
MKFLVFGAGAIGSVFGGFLAEAGHDVSLVGRPAHIKAILKDGLRISGIWGEKRIIIPKSYSSIKEIPEEEEFDAIFISVKSLCTKEAAREIAPLVGKDCLVISLQNGIGNVEIIAETIGKERTVGGRVIFGVEFHKPGEVEITVYAEEVMLGHPWASPFIKKTKIIANEINKAGIPTLFTGEIRKYLWAKLLYNASLNPLSTILGVPYGYLSEHEETRELMKQIIDECFEVAKGENIPLFWEKGSDYYSLLIKKLIPATKEHHPSMLQDINKGKKTEIDVINGAIMTKSKKLGISTPVNDTITRLIHALEG